MSSALRGAGLRIGGVHTAVATIAAGLAIGGCGGTREGLPGEHTPAHGRSASACARAPCKSAPPAAPGSPGSSAAHVSRDEDGDWDFNSDENAIRYYGRPAGAREREAIATAVRRYYEAIATGDGARACSLIDPGFGRELLAAYGRRSSDTALGDRRRTGCRGLSPCAWRGTADTSCSISNTNP
jgi:hypothetical protein